MKLGILLKNNAETKTRLDLLKVTFDTLIDEVSSLSCNIANPFLKIQLS